MNDSMRPIRSMLRPTGAAALVLVLAALTATAGAAGALGRSDGRVQGGCPNETFNGGKFVGRQTLRFVLIRGVSCGKAHRMIAVLYRHVRTGTCEGNRCIVALPGGWSCSFFVATESAETGGALGGCFRATNGAKLRVYSALDGFRSADGKIWCSGGFSSSGGYAPEVGCVTSSTSADLGAIVKGDGGVTLCGNKTPDSGKSPETGHVASWACYQNFDKGAPVLGYGQQIEGAGFRCMSERDGITCIVASGDHAGNGFRISSSEVVEVSG